MVHKRIFTEHGFGKYIVRLHRCLLKADFTLALNPLHMLFFFAPKSSNVSSFSIAT